MLKICLYDHHEYPIPTDGIGGIIGLFQILYQELRTEQLHLTLIINDNSSLTSDKNFNVVKLPFEEINNIRYGTTPISQYFTGDIFYSNASGRHCNFNFTNFKGKWVSMCHGCEEWVGGSDCQIFVSNNQLKQHFRDNLFDSFCNDYRIVHGAVNTDKLYYEEGPHNRIVWMGRIDGAKAERLYDIAKESNEIILAAGWYSPQWEWLFDKIINTGKVEWIGEIKGEDSKRKFYTNAKISIHCSTFEDPCPTTILEAQSCGIPVITYANGSMNEIIFDKSLIFNDLKSFIEKLNTISSYSYNNKIVQHIQSNFTPTQYGKKFLKIFKSVINNENSHIL